MQPELRGNFISEWFGYRTYPTVQLDALAIKSQQDELCPFLTQSVGQDRECVKPENSRGVCTISTLQAKSRVDWLVCPYRALDPTLLGGTLGVLFGESADPLYVPAPSLALEEVREEIAFALRNERRCFVFFNSKLGGELSIAGTPTSPEFSFDLTVLELNSVDEEITVGRFGVLEIQTMDFHGSYKAAVTNLRDGLRLHKNGFAEALGTHTEWLSEDIEGPNIANVFKRTFYQLAFKFEIGETDESVGCVLAIPEAVWNSWQPHLAAPELTNRDDGSFALVTPGRELPDRPPAWIFVFRIDAQSTVKPAPIVIVKRIATNVEALSYFALKKAPENAIASMQSEQGLYSFVQRRMKKLWPELAKSIRPSGH